MEAGCRVQIAAPLRPVMLCAGHLEHLRWDIASVLVIAALIISVLLRKQKLVNENEGFTQATCYLRNLGDHTIRKVAISWGKPRNQLYNCFQVWLWLDHREETSAVSVISSPLLTLSVKLPSLFPPQSNNVQQFPRMHFIFLYLLLFPRYFFSFFGQTRQFLLEQCLYFYPHFGDGETVAENLAMSLSEEG